MHNNKSFRRLPTMLGGLLLAATLPAYGYEMADLGHSTVDIDIQALLGAFHSDRGYANGAAEARRYRWQEGVLTLGAELNPKEGGLYGRVSTVGTATWGDGDAAGFTSGNERELELEDAFLGYRSESLGDPGSPWRLDVSAGRQPIILGDGFLVAGDATSLGDALGDELDRGGAYYLAGRQAFDRTAMVTLGREGWQGQLAWFESDNPAQASTEMAALTLSHDHGSGLVEATYLRGLGVDEAQADEFLTQRDGMDVYGLRVEQRLLDEALSLRGELAHQRKDTRENAWAVEPAWTFSELPGQPTLSLRYSRFSEGWDPLFFGATRGYGTWFQGEVAANYAGPFNSNAEVWRLGLEGSVNESLNLGLLAYDFSSRDTVDQPDMGGREYNLYLEWLPTDWLYVSPLLGWYAPDRSAEQGGTQLGDDDTSFYAQLLVGVFF
ncbi:hypothetical protein OCT51_00365 [Halomonas sp. LR3S48]|uniref:hypothetical protein n=1 Tax=Halomonas sp. LR3S48 TaxID=2982694 RepID=UPI0021E4653B|nr:hypothetical protein [Halomonas sp. LR3S48]UYG03843.1 hypothetical protein OCT51_00365 [Halomonas sp. LR3S48]